MMHSGMIYLISCEVSSANEKSIYGVCAFAFMILPTLDDVEVSGKTVMVRADINSPLDPETLELLDTSRIRQILPTLRALMLKKSAIVILAHQGRPGGWDFTGLGKHAQVLSDLLGIPVHYVEDIYGAEAQQAIGTLQEGEVLMLDNVRAFEGECDAKSPEEHARSALVHELAPLIDVYVNDAFAAAHRSHCSLVGFPPIVSSCAGRLLEQEVKTLTLLLEQPQRPNLFVFGGAKYSNALKVICHLLESDVADTILLGGVPGTVFAFPEQVESAEQDIIRRLMHQYGNRLKLPVDVAVDTGKRQEVAIGDIDLGQTNTIKDIGAATINLFRSAIADAGTVLMSGPLGVFEEEAFALGTRAVMQAMASSRAFSIIGGGHTVAAAESFDVSDGISYVSTGGGSLERFLMGQDLPVIAALKQYGGRKH